MFPLRSTIFVDVSVQEPAYAIELTTWPGLNPSTPKQLDVARKVNGFPLVVHAYEKYPVTVLYDATIPQSAPAAAVINFALSDATNAVPENDPAVSVIVKAFPFGAV